LFERIKNEFPWILSNDASSEGASDDMTNDDSTGHASDDMTSDVDMSEENSNHSLENAEPISEDATEMLSGSEDEFEETDEPLSEEESDEISTKRKRDDGFDQLSKEESIARLRAQEEEIERLRALKRQNARGYVETNPMSKNEINAFFASVLPPEFGMVALLDHTDFKTAKALMRAGVNPRDMVIPQREKNLFDQMRRDHTFGESVVFGEFNQVLSSFEGTPFRGIYADFCGPLAEGMKFVDVCKTLRLLPNAVIGITITLRNPNGNPSFTNSAIHILSIEMNEQLKAVSFRDAEGVQIQPMTYGDGAPMVTILKRKP
jgi:hypothetical protein